MVEVVNQESSESRLAAMPRQKRTKTSVPGTQVQSLSRALSLMEELANAPAGLTLGESAARTGLATSTAHRLLTTLEHHRYVSFNRNTNRWSIGVQAFAVGNAYARSRNFVGIARRYMRQLMEEVGESVNLATLDGTEIVYIAQVECQKMMRAFATPGSRVPMHCSAVGKSLLAAMPLDQARKLLNTRGLDKVTEHTIVRPDVILTELSESRLRGYAIDDEEHALGLRCVASAIYDETGAPVAAVSVSGPTVRIDDDRIIRLGQQISQLARKITADLGGIMPPVQPTG